MGEHFIIWIKSHCPFCVKARDELFRQKVNHTINIMDNDLDELDSQKEKWNHQTVPIVVHRNGGAETLIGGYTDLKEWFGEDKDD
jgi:glutaredoxin